jgi:hypothetical protein
MIQTIKSKIEKKEKELAELKAKLEQEQNNNEWVSINKFKKGYELATKQQFNGNTYAEILKKVKEEEIADYPLLQELRNSGKFEFLKEFWVFVPNLDNISKKNNYVARFVADSDGALLSCDGLPDYSIPSLGVFLIRKFKQKIN